MHLSHFKSTDAGGVIAEALRLTDEAGNLKVKTSRDGHVDLARLGLDYDLIGRSDPLQYYKQRLTEIKVAKRSADINTLSTTITYLPAEYLELPEVKQRAFFDEVTAFLKTHYGEENCLYAVVHNDENRPHLHFGAIPVEHREQKVTKSGKVREAGDYLSCKSVDSRIWCSQLHTSLDKYLRSRLPWYRGGLMADDEQERAKGSLELSAYREVKEAEKQVKALKQEVARESNRIAYISTISNNTVPHSLPDSKRKAIEEGRGVKLTGEDSTALRSLLIDGRKAREQVSDVEVRESATTAMRMRLEAGEADLKARVQNVNRQIAEIDTQLNDRERAVSVKEREADRLLDSMADLLDDYTTCLNLDAFALADKGMKVMEQEIEETGRAADFRKTDEVAKLDDRIEDHNRIIEAFNRIKERAGRLLETVTQKLTERMKLADWRITRDGLVVKPQRQERASQSPSWTYWRGGNSGHER